MLKIARYINWCTQQSTQSNSKSSSKIGGTIKNKKRYNGSKRNLNCVIKLIITKFQK